MAEHTLALMLGLNRHIHRAHNRVRDANFSLDGLVGFDMAGKTAAVIGTGKIWAIVARLLWHLRCDVLAVDPFEDENLLHLGSVALDVYEEEGDLFFEDRSDEIIDDVFARLLTFPNVLITAHQGFLTREALSAIVETTLANVRTVLAGPAMRQRHRISLDAGESLWCRRGSETQTRVGRVGEPAPGRTPRDRAHGQATPSRPSVRR